MGQRITSLVFQPPDVTYTLASTRRYQLIWLRSGIHRIPALFIDKKADVTILFSHGNAEDLGMTSDWIMTLSDVLGVNVFAYDYTGYGRATGVPSEQGCYSDIDAAFNYLTINLKLSSESIVVFGRSLGTGPSCYLAERLSKSNVKLGGLILQVCLIVYKFIIMQT